MEFYKNLSYDLLEMLLNGDALNAQIIKNLFKQRPDILEDMHFGEGITVENLDQHLYGGGETKTIEIRTAKPHEIYTCVPCGGKVFRRVDNFRRHLNCSLHQRRLAQYQAAKKLDAPAEEAKRPDSPEAVKVV